MALFLKAAIGALLPCLGAATRAAADAPATGAEAQFRVTPADDVYEFDASRQTTRVNANVSSVFGLAAVRLNDKLLRRASLPEIRAVMAHELGHDVLNHVYQILAEFALLPLAGFLFTK